MIFEEFQRRSRFGREDLLAYAAGELLQGAPAGLPALSGSLLLAFHEITSITWDEKTGTGRISAVRSNRIDDWYYACHFLGDPVMPGCWGIDAVWQCLKFFAAWRGLAGCDKTLGMENVRFFGQIRPYDRAVRYCVDIVSIERADGECLLTGRAAVAVDDVPVYTIGTAQLGTVYWEKTPGSQPRPALPPPAQPFRRSLKFDEFSARSFFTHPEVIALSQSSLVDDPPGEMSLLPSSLMLGIDQVDRIAYDPATGEGSVCASQRNSGLEWFYPMNRSEKPSALSIDSVWQLLGLFLAWRKAAGTGRALGFERVEVFDAIGPRDRDIRYEVRVLKVSESTTSGDSFARADAQVFADGRLILGCANANVGCHKDIRYSDYPLASVMSLGGKVKTR